MKPYAKTFYKSVAWQQTRDAYAKSVGYLCECCLKKGIYNPGEIVHHKIHLTPENINRPEISLAWENLQLLCRDCHAKMHGNKKRYRIDKNGRVVGRNTGPPPIQTP